MEKSSDMPLVSIIVPVYNVENYIEKCLESVKNQSYTKFECLIVNDGSKDKSIDLAQSFIDGDSRFKILNKPNGGLASARNFGIKHSIGDFIAFLDSDDAWMADKTQMQLALFSSNTDADLVYSKCEILEETKCYPYTGASYSGSPLELLYANTIIGSGSSVMMRRKVFENIGGFNETLKSFEDLEYWFRAAIYNFKFYYCEEIGVTIFKRSSSLSQDKANMRNANLASFKIQLNELLKLNFPLSEIHNASLKRINKARKYFNVGAYFSNFSHILSMTLIYLRFLLRLSFSIKTTSN